MSGASLLLACSGPGARVSIQEKRGHRLLLRGGGSGGDGGFFDASYAFTAVFMGMLIYRFATPER